MARKTHLFLCAVLLGALASATPGLSTPPRQTVKKGPTAGPGQLAFVGAIVMRPNRVAVRVVVSKQREIAVAIVMSCRKGIQTRVARSRLTGTAPYTKPVRLPIGGANNCAVSATGTNPAAPLRLELLRSD